VFSLALISMLEGSPLNPMVTGTGRVDSDGNVHQVGNLREKAIAVQQSEVKRFLVPYDQNFQMLPRDEMERQLLRSLHSHQQTCHNLRHISDS
jgi:ATP-dependent Lon protease